MDDILSKESYKNTESPRNWRVKTLEMQSVFQGDYYMFVNVLCK